MSAPLLEVDALRTHFFTRDGVVHAVDGVSFAVEPGETLALVGESGCGKSVTSLSIMRLVASPPGRVVSGAVRFNGRDLLRLSEPEMRKVRFRTLGCYPLTGAVESDATTLPDIIQEMLLATTSERQGRVIDFDQAGSMEEKKKEGYF